jgi:hypothetical protein
MELYTSNAEIPEVLEPSTCTQWMSTYLSMRVKSSKQVEQRLQSLARLCCIRRSYPIYVNNGSVIWGISNINVNVKGATNLHVVDVTMSLCV